MMSNSPLSRRQRDGLPLAGRHPERADNALRLELSQPLQHATLTKYVGQVLVRAVVQQHDRQLLHLKLAEIQLDRPLGQVRVEVELDFTRGVSQTPDFGDYHKIIGRIGLAQQARKALLLVGWRRVEVPNPQPERFPHDREEILVGRPA